MRRGLTIVGWVTLALVVGGWFAFLRPPVFGGGTELVVVHGNSMRPTYEPGDVVVTRKSDHYSTGQVVAYKVDGGRARVIHRIVEGTSEGFATQGDNRTSEDPWTPTAADITGRPVLHIPRLGSLMASVSRSPLTMAATAGLAAFLAAIWPDVRYGLSPARLRRAHRGRSPKTLSEEPCAPIAAPAAAG